MLYNFNFNYHNEFSDLHKFDFNYYNESLKSSWLALLDLTMETDIVNKNYRFTIQYNIYSLSNILLSFKNRYKLIFERKIYKFVTNFNSNINQATRVYRYLNFYKIYPLDDIKYEFYSLYDVYTIKDAIKLNFTFRYQNSFFGNKIYKFINYYDYNKSQEIQYKFNLINRIRLNDDGKTLDNAGTFIWDSNNNYWKYIFTLTNINLVFGDYLLIINNGSKYSNLFLDLKIDNFTNKNIFTFNYKYNLIDSNSSYKFDLNYKALIDYPITAVTEDMWLYEDRDNHQVLTAALEYDEDLTKPEFHTFEWIQDYGPEVTWVDSRFQLSPTINIDGIFEDMVFILYIDKDIEDFEYTVELNIYQSE